MWLRCGSSGAGSTTLLLEREAAAGDREGSPEREMRSVCRSEAPTATGTFSLSRSFHSCVTIDCGEFSFLSGHGGRSGFQGGKGGRFI